MWAQFIDETRLGAYLRHKISTIKPSLPVSVTHHRNEKNEHMYVLHLPKDGRDNLSFLSSLEGGYAELQKPLNRLAILYEPENNALGRESLQRLCINPDTAVATIDSSVSPTQAIEEIIRRDPEGYTASQRKLSEGRLP